MQSGRATIDNIVTTLFHAYKGTPTFFFVNDSRFSLSLEQANIQNVGDAKGA
jgi:hypothetical protein